MNIDDIFLLDVAPNRYVLVINISNIWRSPLRSAPILLYRHLLLLLSLGMHLHLLLLLEIVVLLGILMLLWSDCLGTILLRPLVFRDLGCASDQMLNLIWQTLQHIVLLVIVLHVESARSGCCRLSLSLCFTRKLFGILLLEIHVNFSPWLHFGDVKDTR